MKMTERLSRDTVDRVAPGREFFGLAFHDFESWAKTRDWSALHV